MSPEEVDQLYAALSEAIPAPETELDWLNPYTLLVAVGARFDDRVIGNPAHFFQNPRTIIHIDVDPASISKTVRVDVPIVGEVRPVLEELIEVLHLVQARKVIEKRRSLGRSIARGTPRNVPDVTSSSLVRTYQKEVERQKLMVKKAEFAQQRLLFVVEAMRHLLADENFTNLLRAEGLETLPKHIAERVWPGGNVA